MMRTLVSKARSLLAGGVTARLAGGYLVLITLILLEAAIGIINISMIRKSYDAVLDVRIPRIGELQGIQELLAELNANAHQAMLSADAQQQAQLYASVESGRAKAGERLEALQQALEAERTPASSKLAELVSNDASAVLIGLVKFSRLAKAGKREQALMNLQDSIKPQLRQLASHISTYQQQQIAILSDVKHEAVRQEQAVRQQTLLLSLVALLIAAGFAIWIVRSVVSPLREATAVANFMARGDFSHLLQSHRRDEVGQVSTSFNQIASGLSDLVTDIRNSSDLVHEVAQNMAERTLSLEDRAASQTRTLSEALHFIDGVQKANEDNLACANQAARMAMAMDDVAHRSTESVNQAVHEMAMVRQSSQQITDIISLIDGIAFQTNILALNAAVEAARAGEQGRSFAVVASEVRSLAGRSAAASKEVKELILMSQSRVAGGTDRVQSIARVMAEVTQTVSLLKQQVEHIANASQQQSMHVQEMMAAISNLLAGNDSNVQIVGGLRLALDELRETAQHLNDKVSAFRTQQSLPA